MKREDKKTLKKSKESKLDKPPITLSCITCKQVWDGRLYDSCITCGRKGIPYLSSQYWNAYTEEVGKDKGQEDFEWKLEIRRESNGYTLKGKFGDTDMVSTVVIEDKENDELSSGEQLLWTIIDYYNFGGSKHDKERIKVVREKGESG